METLSPAHASLLDALPREFEEALLAIDRTRAFRLMEGALNVGIPALRLAQTCITPALERIGQGWELGTLALSQVYMSGRISEEVVNSLFPEPEVLRGRQPAIALALLEDYHALGKRMVQLALRSAGYRCLDYGRVTAEELSRRIQEEAPDLVLVSTLMYRSALRVEAVTSTLARAGCGIPLCVGGAPFRFHGGLWKNVGADAWGAEASDAVAFVEGRMAGAP